MCPWFDRDSATDLLPAKKQGGTEVFEAVSLSRDRLQDLADYLGVQLTTDRDGHFVAVPPNVDTNDPEFQRNFLTYWLDQATTSSSQEKDRARKIQAYRAMDLLMAEASISLDTYADEALGVGFLENPVQVQINNKAVNDAVMEILFRNDITKRSRSLMRNMIKYGDLGYDIQLPRDPAKTLLDINLEYVDPMSWSCRVSDAAPKLVLGYSLGSISGGRRSGPNPSSKKDIRQLWEFIQMSVYDEDSRPYGRSLLEPMRSDFDHLCLSGDTKVFTLDGSVPIKDLVGKPEFWVLACDPSTMKMVPRKGRFARITRKNSKFVKVNLLAHPGKNSSIIVTPDHKFLMSDGTYREAQHLSWGDSVAAAKNISKRSFIANSKSLDSEKYQDQLYNHKVIFVESLDYREDAYDIEVEEFHNFLVDLGDDTGVVVHNCTMEALLALSRASRVDRLVIRAPTGSTNAVSAAQKLQQIKGQLKNAIFKDSSMGTRTYARTPALNEMIFMPSDQGFDITRLPSNIDFSTTDDVDYFRNKVFTATGLPKGFFLHDDTFSRGAALQQQDIQFARKLIQFQEAFAEGLVKMITILSVYVAGTYISDLEVQVKLKRPPQLAESVIDYYQKVVATAFEMVQTYTAIMQQPTTPDMFVKLLRNLGMPEQVANVFNQAGMPIQPQLPTNYMVSSTDIVRTNKDIPFLRVFRETKTLDTIKESTKNFRLTV